MRMTRPANRRSLCALFLLSAALLGLSGLGHVHAAPAFLSGDWSTSLTLVPNSFPLLEDFSSSLVLRLERDALSLRSDSRFSVDGYTHQGFEARLDTDIVETTLGVGFKPFPAEFTSFFSETEFTIPALLTGVPIGVEVNWSYHYGAWELETELSAYLDTCHVRIDTYYSFSDTCTLAYESTHAHLSGLTFGCLELNANLKTSSDNRFEFLEVSTSYCPDDSILSWSADVELDGVDDLYVEVSPSLNVWSDHVTLELDVDTGEGTGLSIDALRIESLHATCRLESTTLRFTHYMESGTTSLSLNALDLRCSVTFKRPGGLFELHDLSIGVDTYLAGVASIEAGFRWRATTDAELSVSVDVPF